MKYWRVEATSFSHLNVFHIWSSSCSCWFFVLPNIGWTQHLFLPSTSLPSYRPRHHHLSCGAWKKNWTNFVFLPLVLLSSKMQIRLSHTLSPNSPMIRIVPTMPSNLSTFLWVLSCLFSSLCSAWHLYTIFPE